MRLVHHEAKLFPLAKSLASSSQTVAAPKRAGQYSRQESPKNKTKSTQTAKFECLKLELLPRFELGTSSLPTDWKPRECRCSALSGPFCYSGTWSLALSRPLSPPAFFRVWVTVWVKPKSRSRCGVLLRERKFQPDCPLLLIGDSGNLLFCRQQFTIEGCKIQVPHPHRICYAVNNIGAVTLCSSLIFHLYISPFIPIDFRLLFRYCVAYESPTKY